MKKKTKEKTLKYKKTKEFALKKEKIKPRESQKRLKTTLINNINQLQSNESIVKMLLDKIIAVSVRKANINKIINQLDDYYFDYLKNQINALFSINNIFYCDEPENSIINNSCFWKTDYNKCNTWVEVEEPSTIRCDRFENAFINYVNINKDNDEDIENKSNPEIIPTNKDKLSDKKNKNLYQKFAKNNLDVLEEKSSRESFDDENKYAKMTQKKFLNNSTKTNFNKSQTKNNINSKSSNLSSFPTTKRTKNGIIEMDTQEIPGIREEFDFGKYEPSNINFLRREKEDQILRRAKEAKKIFFNSQNKVDNIQNLNENEEIRKEVKNIKLFDSNKYSFDSNGKIISFKPLKIDIFSKDFALLKNTVRNFKKKRNTIKKVNKYKEENNESIKEKDKDKDKEKKEGDNIIKNPVDYIEGINRNQHMKSLLEKNEKIIPSGSNFSLMFPNIGVVLKENENIKRGQRDFGKYFKKYSLEDYDKILKDYVPLQNKTMMLNKMGKITRSPVNRSMSKHFVNNNNSRQNLRKKSIKDISDNNKLILSSSSINNNNINNNSVMINNNSEFTNPLINQERDNESISNNNLNNNTSNINYNIIKTMKLNKNSFNNSLMSSINNYNSLSMSPINKNINNMGTIKLNKDGISSLKVEFDSLKDLDYKNINNYYSPSRTGMKSINIFGKNYKDIFKNIVKDKNTSKDINELNKKIITNTGWGNNSLKKNMSSENLLFGKHQTRYQAIRELGSNILNSIKVKLPRNRKINIQI